MRVFRIVDDITKGLPDDHPIRLPVNAIHYRSFFTSQLSNGNEVGNDSNQQNASGENNKKGDGRGSRTSARPPAMSLKAFVQTSRKRRKLYVSSYHPEAFTNVEVVKLG